MMGRVRMNLGGSWQGETLRDNLERRGVSRRDFMKLCGGLAAVFAFGSPERAPGCGGAGTGGKHQSHRLNGWET